MKGSFVSLCLLLSLFCSFVFSSTVNPITSLPSYSGPTINFKQYTGYITVDATSNRNIFYWLVESQNNPSTDPLVVWFQGGPGCSGLGGLLTENGPFRPDGNGGITYNDVTWNAIANVLYIEQPAGVGYSYSDNPLDYNTNDTRAAEDNYAALQGFLQLFPEYVGRDLWLTGESYGGVYMPTLTAQILNGPDSGLSSQLKGLMLGNPVTCWTAMFDVRIQFNIFYWHGLVSYVNYNSWLANQCDLNANGTICQNIYNNTVAEIGVINQPSAFEDSNFPSLDPDDLYQDFCAGNGTLEFSIDDPNTCNSVDDQVSAYLNRADVQAALGANPTTWIECTDKINYTVSFDSMLPLFEQFFQQRPDLNILFYSGDVDVATVPFWSTASCLSILGRRRTSVWQPWFVNGATAGYVEVYDTYTFATLKGAGHEAPGYQPLNAFELFQRYLTTQSLNDETEKAKWVQRQKLASQTKKNRQWAFRRAMGDRF